MMGAERRSSAMTEDEKRLTAYHEAGHAIVALNVPSADPVHKATIIPRGRALGMVMQLPEGDRYSMSYKQMTSRLAIMMGGRVAEEMIFGKEKVTSGASVRHRAGDQAGPRHGDPLGLLRRARHGRLRREPGRGVPRHVGGAASRTSPKRRRRRSTPRCAAWSSTAYTEARRILDREARRPRRRWPRACSNTRRCPATRSGTCSTASRRCATAATSRRASRGSAVPTRRASGQPAPGSRKAAWSRSRRPEPSDEPKRRLDARPVRHALDSAGALACRASAFCMAATMLPIGNNRQ